MSSDKFRQTEEQYFLLKGQLETGRITRDQFEAALKTLMIQDTQGRYWMVGADTGKWYVYDGKTWLEALPPGMAPTTTGSQTPPATAGSAPASPTPRGQARRSSGMIAWMVIGAGVVLVLCLVAALLLASSSGMVNIGLLNPTSTAFPPLSPVFSSPVPSFPGQTVVMITATPAVKAAATNAPTIAVSPPLQSPSPTVTVPATAPPATIPAKVPATSVPAQPTARPPTPIPATPTLSLPPGIYVTSIATNPAEVKNGQFPTFQVTFINSLGYTAYYNWYVKLYEPDKKSSFGETAKTASSIPAGTTVIASAANWKAIGATPCRQFIARVFFVSPDNTILEFPKPSGDSFWHYFTICD